MPRPLVELAAHPRVVAIGESGLDYFYDHAPARSPGARASAPTSRPRASTGLPLIVHTRDADDDTMALLEAEMARGAVHRRHPLLQLEPPPRPSARSAIGLYLGIGGILTFKKSDELRATVRDMPLDRLLLETDAPYLAPVPYARPHQRAGLHRARRQGAGRGPRAAGGRDRGRHHRQLPSPVRQGRRHARDGAGLRHLLGRAADRLRLRRLPLARPAQPPPCAARSASRRKGQRILVDTGPDLRQQCLDAGIGEIDALIYTHAHADHVHGIDDLRAINNLIMAPIPTWADAAVFDRIRERFPYVLRRRPRRPRLVAARDRATRWSTGRSGSAPVEIVPFPQRHGRGTTWGFRIGRFAYSTDTDGLDEQRVRDCLRGVEVWIVDALRDRPHPEPRPSLELTLAWIDRVEPAQAYLTHMNHEVDYTDWCARLPAGVLPAHDGLVLEAAETIDSRPCGPGTRPSLP